MSNLKAPFPYFGGKSMITDVVWERLGATDIYIEPFFGSGAMLLGRPEPFGKEIVNDLNGYVTNFWRAIQSDPDQVAHYAENPQYESDFQARHLWLLTQRTSLVEHLEVSPGYFDAKIAGWWCWILSTGISGPFCVEGGPWAEQDGRLIKFESRRGRPRPNMIRYPIALKEYGIGVNRKRGEIQHWMRQLQARMRHVLVTCNNWNRSCSNVVLERERTIAIFLDPPYGQDRHQGLYGEEDSSTIHQEVSTWCLKKGRYKKIRIALCGFEGEHEHLQDLGWTFIKWKAGGGHSRRNKANQNRYREIVWFSPHCLKPSNEQLDLLTE